mgnify:CR=1 FL=1
MAYLTPLDVVCTYQGCGKRAVVQLRNNRNERIAVYCQPHGNQRLKEFAAVESQAGKFNDSNDVGPTFNRNRPSPTTAKARASDDDVTSDT